MAAIQTLVSKAVSEYNVQLHGIEPRAIPNHGIGVVALTSLKPNDLLLHVPKSAFRTLDNTHQSIITKLPRSATVHSILALGMALDTSPFFSVWRACMPTPMDFADMPVRWSHDLSSQLPTAARKALRLQTSKFDKDWAQVYKAFPEVPRDEFLHCWLLVNTRSFHHDTPATRNRRSQDKMILQPVADLFNHSSHGACRVSFDSSGFCVWAEKAYAPGDEVTFCYGQHANDALLVEYGFTVDDNPWDDTLLDDVIIPRLSAQQKDLLVEYRFLGMYHFDINGACHRTQAALRSLFLPLEKWRDFAKGVDDGAESQEDVDKILKTMLEEYLEHIDGLLAKLDTQRIEEEHPLYKRWLQIKSMLDYSPSIDMCTG